MFLGTTGDITRLKSNYFKLKMREEYVLHQYSVEYFPEVPNERMRIVMLYEHRSIIGDVDAFDGMQLFLPIRLRKNVSCYILLSFLNSMASAIYIEAVFLYRCPICPSSQTNLKSSSCTIWAVLAGVMKYNLSVHGKLPELAPTISSSMF